jgi:uncharacterized protein (TIGR03437 family)
MISSKLRCFMLVAAAVSTVHLEGASQIWITPPTSSVTTIPSYTATPLAFIKSLTAPAVGFKELFQTPSGDKFYFVGSAGDAVYAYSSDLSSQIATFPLVFNCPGATMTPDGRQFLAISGGLRIFDTTTDKEVGPSGGVDVGAAPAAVAASLDSTRAYVLDPNNFRLLAVDLSLKTVAGTVTGLVAGPRSVSVGPNGFIYVGAVNVVYEIDPVTLTIRNQIAVDGTPGELRFTPDGTKAAALNRAITSSWAILLNLTDHKSLGTVANTGDAPDAISIVGDSQMYATSSATGRFYRIDFSPLAIQQASFDNVGNVIGVVSTVASREIPLAKYLYFTDSNNVYRLDVTSNNVDSSVPLGSSPGALLYTGAAGTAASASIVRYNDGQVVAGGAVSAPLVIRALDVNGGPVYNAPVVWTTSTGATLSVSSSWTNRDGLAETFVTAPTAAGAFLVTARVGTSGPVQANFTLTSGTGSVGNTASIAVYSGNGQIVWSGSKGDYPLTAQVLDSGGKPVSGVTVTWTVSDGGGGTLASSSVTDDNGLASTNFFGGYVDSIYYSFTKSHVTATASGYGTATFVATTVPITLMSGGSAQYPALTLVTPASANRVISAKLGQTLTAGVVVQVSASSGSQTGTPMSDIGLFLPQDGLDPTTGPVAKCSGGTVLSGADGKASCNVIVTGTVGTRVIRVQAGGSFGWDVILTATIGDPGKIAIISGDGQSVAPGGTLPVTLVGEVSDGYGNLLPGTEVTWAVVPSTAATLSNVVGTADANGRVSAKVTAGSTAGSFQVTVQTKTGSGAASFAESVVIALATPTKASGDNQSAVVATAFAKPLVIQVNDTKGNAAQGVGVAWAISGPGTLSNSSATTDAQGQASTNVKAGSTTGTITVTATVGSTVLTFTLTSRLAGPVVSATDFYNGAGYQPGVTPGGIVIIRGTGLASTISGVVTGNTIIGPLPYSLAGVSVTFGNTPAPIYYVANMSGTEQVAVQAPFELMAGTTAVTITVNGSPTVVNNVTVLAYQPGIFQTTDSNNNTYAVLLHADGSYVTRENPAHRGEILRMFATGLGQTSPATGTGRAGVGGQTVVAPLLVGVGPDGVRIVSTEYMEGTVGVYVITFEVPSTAATGTSVSLALATVSSNTATFGNGSNFSLQP